MTALVTGATGFLGSHLIDVLLARGTTVRALVRPQTDAAALRDRGIDVVVGTLSDERSLRSAASDCELVYHLAGLVSHRRRDLTLLREVNVLGTRRVLAAAEPSARVVHVSSVAAIGPVASPTERASESHPFPEAAAKLPYAGSKHDAELAVTAAAEAGRNVVIANPGFLLGPGDVHRGSTWPVSAYVSGRFRFTTSGGLAFVDVRDVAHGLTALAEHGRPGERTIFAGEEGNLSWQAFFSLLSAVTGVRRRTVDLPTRIAPTAATLAPWLVSRDDVRAAAHWWFFSAAKAERELGFSTRPLADTVHDTISDHRR